MKRIEDYSGHERLVLRMAIRLRTNPARRGAKALRDRSCLLWGHEQKDCASGFSPLQQATINKIHELPKSGACNRTVAEAAF